MIIISNYNNISFNFNKKPFSLQSTQSFNSKFTMKTFTIVLGLLAAVSVSDIVSAGRDLEACGNRRSVRCISLSGRSAFEDTDSTMMALKNTRNEKVCGCQKDKGHVYVVAEHQPDFEDIMVKCQSFAYRGKTCLHH
ncbi:hypothetical protein BGZ72_009373 [Mortierella alpina]|nr:hypothetical protein BGZ72_009373 [Mortierella alpina]